jgi:replicative DNA helicase
VNDDAQKLMMAHASAGTRVLAAWFDDAKFRAAFVPNEDLFCFDTQKSIARICAARGATLSRDDLILHLDRQQKLKLWENGAEGVLDELLTAQIELNPWAAVDRLREVAGARYLARRAGEIALELLRGESMAAAREGLANALRDADFASGAKAKTVRESMALAYKHATETDRKPGARTISKRLDEATGGITPGTVWLLAAGTSWGKSSFIVAMANRALKDGLRPLVVTVEDPERLFGSRLLLARTNVNALRLRQARLLPDETKRVADSVVEAEDTPWLLPAIGRTAEAIAADIRSLVIAHQIDIVMVDYVQRMRSAERSQDKRNEINRIGYLMTDAIKESGAGGILFSQLTEDTSTGKMKARESEDLHNSAETVLFGITETVPEINASGVKVGEEKLKKLYVKKCKEGPAEFPIELAWNKHSACFISDYDADDRQLALGLVPPPVDPSYDEYDNYAAQPA